ncbi:MAG: hypothetical protein NVSMB19_18610 [Vulcanimicrobiaceae bacterium]
MKYRKRPIVIEATQFFENRMPWPDGVVRIEMGQFYGKYQEIGVYTLEGFVQVRDGDWIITGIVNEKYPCKPDVFAATYDQVEEFV